MNFLGFENSDGLSALPSGGDLDEHAVAADARRLVEADDPAGLRNGSLNVKRKPGVNLSADATGNVFQN